MKKRKSIKRRPIKQKPGEPEPEVATSPSSRDSWWDQPDNSADADDPDGEGFVEASPDEMLTFGGGGWSIGGSPSWISPETATRYGIPQPPPGPSPPRRGRAIGDSSGH